MSTSLKPTRREQRRAQTVHEIKHLAMEQIRSGGPEAVSLSGIVREMSMSPAAVYRYFANRDALLADLVVDAYNELADSLADLQEGTDTAEHHLDAVLRGSRKWALVHPNAYRLIFQSTIGSGEEFAADRLIPAASRSMNVIIHALAAVTGQRDANPQDESPSTDVTETLRAWGDRSGFGEFSTGVLELAMLTWTRLHGIISLELGGHLAATGIGPDVLFDLEVHAIHSWAAALPGTPQPSV